MLLKPLLLLSSLALLLDSAVGAALQQRSLGCGKTHDFPGQSRDFTLTSGGRTRSYRLHLPSNYDPNASTSLLFVYHGASGNPAGFETQSRFSNETINPNMITVYPAGVDGNWQGPTYATPGVNDIAFTSDLVIRIKDSYCINDSRIYAVGYSNGGGFVNTLACSPEGNFFAAFAGVAAALYTDVTGDTRCTPSRSRLPFLEAHGTADATIPYNGGTGRGGPLPAIGEWLTRWARRNQCTTSTTTDRGNRVTDQSWTCTGSPGVLRHIKIDGHDHSYPGPTNGQIYITPVIVSFLNSRYKP